jgi:hypothetical protein
MNNTFFKLMYLAVITLSMMIAVQVDAGAQTTLGTSRNMRARIQTRSITVVDIKGEAVRRSDAGNEWETLNTESTQNVVSDLQQKVARHRVAAQTAVIGENMTGETMNDTIVQSGSVQLNEDGVGMVAMSTNIEKEQ